MTTRPSSRADTLAAYRALGYSAPPKAKMSIRGKSQTIQQVVDQAPTLAELARTARDAQNRLKAITPLLPTSLHAALQSGSIEGDTWCILAANNSVAAKLRQMLPALCAHLRSKGWDVSHIQVKVKAASKR